MTKLTTREKLIHAMIDALQRKGLHGVGLNELLEIAGAPKGSLYHHFPGGKTELAVAAIEQVSKGIEGFFSSLFAKHPDPLQVMAEWLRSTLGSLEHSGYRRGCPLATIALESTPEDVEIRQALAATFAETRRVLAQQLRLQGYAGELSGSLAALIVATYEGGLLQARVAGNTESLLQATDALVELIRRYPKETPP
jgi:TetR/AcrR family transcriptional regulator, lmrAB and yxaGH operons repressor